jgi:4-hydroxy-3-methylbut-2-enyl diphosphate reductase
VLAQSIVSRLRELGVNQVKVLEGVEENIAFPLPKGLVQVAVG